MNKNVIIQLVLAAAIAFMGGIKAVGSHLAQFERPPLAPPASPTPTYDPLATPFLTEHPTEIDLGRYSYYYNCMPCHGDLGQGLTDEFRQVWVEDHQYCWGRGCHTGRPNDEGFPIPTIVPAIMLETDALKNFRTFEQLYTYLRTTHPPQRPGKLTDEDYRALTALLWAENGKASAETANELASTEITVTETAEPGTATPTIPAPLVLTASPTVTAQPTPTTPQAMTTPPSNAGASKPGNPFLGLPLALAVAVILLAGLVILLARRTSLSKSSGR